MLFVLALKFKERCQKLFGFPGWKALVLEVSDNLVLAGDVFTSLLDVSHHHLQFTVVLHA
ncbi:MULTISPECIES: hypothetical protein [unclassified Mesorhizobium]|uniref:hypothetical protein n=1 Tax=unclassified Mesorhizobium TaxID=325217 RepID=UPI0013DEBDC3|nr:MULTISPECIES: hypothetical protein [unclassified Mesorhizobium]MCT2578570.1 hypothetical protein [Mesorhizobium sp. P13.3]MDF3167415.1 hypothetical protein [Mesorhizobium sp. P16.1]MDF3179055.1 hypothetical protein [Mesorhizobium sp. P17.1]MDF3184327.1 hypothetical protein [Mesorhizobium sp. ICCV3110.1]